MSRFATIITLDEFKSKCKDKLGIGTEDFDMYDMLESFPKIEKDLSKIQSDFENWNIGNADPSYEKYPSDHQGYNGYPCGYEVLENGMPILFVNAGGDWECPICFCIYWDGSSMRAYIPKDGNVYNVKEKCAFGSEEDADYDDETEHPNGDPAKIRLDVMKRIQIR